MRKRQPLPLQSVRARHGFTLVEAILSSLIVAVLLVSTMRLVGGVARSGQVLSDRASASDLADGLIAEIMTTSYTDPVSPANFGIESGETTVSKSNYDDVDDYNGWTQSVSFTGKAASENLTATVSITRATLATPNTASATESGLKRIKVTVTRGDKVLAVREAWKADAK